jgi:succinyl-diaminopimelate desuccinylase
MYKEVLDRYLDDHKEEMLRDLEELIRIDSVRGEAKEGQPFGEGPAKVLGAAEKLLGTYGFTVRNYDNYVVTGDLNEKEKQLDILAHLDVVPVSPSDWTVTQPFEPVIRDGRIYGRGSADDKGPAIAALYAMRAVKESGIPLSKNVRLILGSDEECGSGDLDYYYDQEEEAPMTFTPDAEFPVINIEKGHLSKSFWRIFEEQPQLPTVTSFHSGTAVNVVPAKATATVKGLTKEEIQQAIDRDKSGVSFQVSKEGDELTIEARGLAAHASTPEDGKNALCALVALLAELPLAKNALSEAIEALIQLFPVGDFHGAALGIDIKDEESGALSMTLDILNYDGKTLKGRFDSRIPICGTDENVSRVIEARLTEKGFECSKENMAPVHYVPADSELVVSLLESYERYTGIKGKPLAIGGGTYVHGLKRGVAFGCEVEGVDNHLHGDDEFMEVDVLLMSAKIFADAIVKLCS